MALYNVFYTSAAARALKHLPREVIADIRTAVEGLAANPRTLHTEKLEGYPHAYRLRIGRYRLLYTIEDEARRVTVYRVAHRKESYRNLSH